MAELTQAQKDRLDRILSHKRGPGTYTGVRYYTVHEESTSSMWYSIRVVDYKGEVVENILRPTMQEAQDALAAKGYRVWEE